MNAEWFPVDAPSYSAPTLTSHIRQQRLGTLAQSRSVGGRQVQVEFLEGPWRVPGALGLFRVAEVRCGLSGRVVGLSVGKDSLAGSLFLEMDRVARVGSLRVDGENICELVFVVEGRLELLKHVEQVFHLECL